MECGSIIWIKKFKTGSGKKAAEIGLKRPVPVLFLGVIPEGVEFTETILDQILCGNLGLFYSDDICEALGATQHKKLVTHLQKKYADKKP